MNYPQAYTTIKDKLAYAHACKEKLRLEHNEQGAKYRNGTLSGWQWNSYTASFNVKNMEVCSEINQLKASVPQDDIDALQITTIDGVFVYEETDGYADKLYKSVIVNKKDDPDEPTDMAFNRQEVPESLMSEASITAK